MLPVRALAFAGPLAAIVFLTSVVGVAAGRGDDYSHAAHWMSELGARDQPHALLFNLTGFMLPGLLIMAFAIGLSIALDTKRGPLFLALSGLAFMLIGTLPLRESPEALVNYLHSLVAHVSGLSFGCALVAFSRVFREHPKFVAIGRLTPCFMAFLILYPASQIAWQEMGPMWQGWPQRVVCAGYFFWLSLAGWRLSTLDLAPPNRRPNLAAMG